MSSPVIKRIVENGMCIGCGLCSAICPHNVLDMNWNRYGEHVPIEVTSCTKECGLCLRVCPFSDSNENEDVIGNRLFGDVLGIQHHPSTGYYLSCHIGYSEEHRKTGASGGMATWLLETMLSDGLVDHIICVAPTGDSEGLFSFQVFDTIDGLRTGAGSAYYPVELSAVIRHVLEEPGRYAITGLPCFIKAIRLAQAKNSILNERIIATVGLVCGQMKSKHFTQYIADLSGIEGKITAVRYRGKSPLIPTNNYFYHFESVEGKESKIFWKDGISSAWVNNWFTPRSCSYCDDIFAECADVTCMDAWLPEHSTDRQGISLVVVRSLLILELIRRNAEALLEPIPIEKLVESQAGVISIKRKQLAHRLHLDHKNGRALISKRVGPARLRNPFLRQEVDIKEQLKELSKEAWINCAGDIGRFSTIMNKDMDRLAKLKKINRILTLPKRTYLMVRRNIQLHD